MRVYMDVPFLAMAIGGIVPIWLIGLLVGRLFFKNMEAGRKILVSTAIAYVIGLVISGYGANDGFSPSYGPDFISFLLVLGLRFLTRALRKDKNA
tara:strand:+ start:182 stop:466 length:285 start_codon:yes stop_codon:yes gene_type:complete